MKRYSVLLIVIACLACVSAAQAGKLKSVYDANSRVRFYDGSTYEQVRPLYPVTFYDEFLGSKFQKIVTNENTVAPWTVTETNVNTAIAHVANAVGGEILLNVDADDNAEESIVYWGDQVSLSALKELSMEVRVNVSVLPTTESGESTYVIFGLASAHAATIDDVATNAWFRIAPADTAIYWETDDGTTDDDDNDSLLEATAGTYRIYRIDFTDTSAKFYVDGAHVGTGVMTGVSASNDNLQPYFRVMKGKSSANTSVGAINVDYVRIWSQR